MIDENGFRANVGIILCNEQKKLFWGHRIGHLDSWQFPQGGIDENETPLEAMFRELKEEIGLAPDDVEVLGHTQGWLKYHLPQKLVRKNNKHQCIGQKQIWFLLKHISLENSIVFDSTGSPEFDNWRWVDYWYPMNQVVQFKQQVYLDALSELAPTLFGASIPPRPCLKQHRERAAVSGFRPLYRMGLRRSRK
ncbi:RNA pyrophosphohydrolase [Gammaproteobacteria bacterium]|nr:RNA pyrophosphohydrolase [Gammaproteobacteria bacterium]